MSKITKKDQRIVAEILTKFAFTNNMDDVMAVWDNIFQEYGLFQDPFTGLPCTWDEYSKNKIEYERQTMIERYGHCDGLD